MAEHTPQDIYFNKANRWSLFRKIVFIGSLLISVILTFISTAYKQVGLNFVNNGVLIVSLVLLFIAENKEDEYRSEADKIRRKELIGNSFGKFYNNEPSIEYYNNDEIETGLYKLIFNLSESCFWSLEVSSRMKDKEFIKTLIIGIILVIIAIYGFGNSLIAIPVLQIFLSKDVISRYITIKNYNNELNIIFEDIKSLFIDNPDKNTVMTNKEHKIIDILLRYECNIASSKIKLESKLFSSKLRKYKLQHLEVEKKWNEIKKQMGVIK